MYKCHSKNKRSKKNTTCTSTAYLACHQLPLPAVHVQPQQLVPSSHQPARPAAAAAATASLMVDTRQVWDGMQRTGMPKEGQQGGAAGAAIAYTTATNQQGP